VKLKSTITKLPLFVSPNWPKPFSLISLTSLRVRLVPSACNTFLEHVRSGDSTQGVLQDCMIGAGEMTLAQVGAREHGLLYYLREYFVAWPTQVSQWSKAWTHPRRGPSARWRDLGPNSECVYTLADECYIVRRTEYE
jgi:hypothetical protein